MRRSSSDLFKAPANEVNCVPNTVSIGVVSILSSDDDVVIEPVFPLLAPLFSLSYLLAPSLTGDNGK